ncbi:MAG: glycosyltransferase family 4 protein [Acidobacteriaceae bacterium]
MPHPSIHTDDQIPTLAAATGAPKLLLMAYECDPYRGSEATVGWGRVQQAAREFEIYVIVSAASLAAIERYSQTNPLPAHVHFHTPKEDTLLRLLRRIPRIFAYNYVAYRQWQRLAYRLAQELHRSHRFALVHQVNVCTFREPSDTWRLGIPFLWGPVGGTQNFPATFLSERSFSGLSQMDALKERARNAANWLSLRRKRRVRQAAARAAVLLAANSTNQRDYEAVFHRPVELLLETGLEEVQPPASARLLQAGPLHILWSGEFTTRKALPLLLQALASLRDVDFHLRILGRGPHEAKWKQLAQELGIAERCHFLGHLPLPEAVAQLQWAHLFVFTSLRDTSGNVVLEALGHGIPVICFDHQGVGDIVTPQCGIKLAVTTPRRATAELADAIRLLAGDRKRLAELSMGASDRARKYLWSENGDAINAIYRRLAADGTKDRRPGA